ncbi:DUF1353 domain-containing protein [Prosthecobacter sp.]|uniref:DUF1353 domain-containing protein n=1 Tax=Prosthecobacter sp. TaxID=1965333 RepID=UPI001DDF7B54|nr:DUF1353 domain-containing protein [Prosthecobacter sp.]MCB1276246.1 DUF1353 domain-containing protein [Prosthecobacter sp.]
MHPVLLLILALSLSSCAANRFYEKVDGSGVIVGRPCIEWKQPDKFVYARSKNPEFSVKRPNGEIIKPGSIETDGGSIPRLLWSQRDFSPWTYAPAYLIHDWMYEAHRRKVPAGIDADGHAIYYTKDQADWIMAEVIKAQMEKPGQFQTKRSRSHLRKIYWAVSKFGKTAWNGEAHPVEEETSSTLITDTLKNLPLLPVLDSIKNELTPVPAKPAMNGSRTHQE